MLITETTIADPKKGSRKVAAITVAILVHVVLAVLFLLIAIVPAFRDEPEIVAQIIAPTSSSEPQMEKKAVMKQVEQASSAAAASPIAKMIRANTTAKIAAPEVTKISDGPLGLGEGDFGSGFGSGSGGGMGSGASFFGAKSTGNRFLFVLDHSASMRDSQVALRDAELEKALKALPASVQYQVILFAGGCLFAEKGWKYDGGGRGNRYNIIDPKGNKYPFVAKNGAFDWEFDGPDSKMPRERWRPATSSNVKGTMEVIREIKKFYGTDWELALKMGHLMDPPPDVIFFMSDGNSKIDLQNILKLNQARGRPKVNTFAMQTSAGAKDFNDIAEGTRGNFVIVLGDGKTINGKDYLRNPGKYAAELK
ncbi:MAG: hypothetical protein KDN20_20505 [Verrucomicrobiae bacterium]|nr:hypothetical protein [Verrucomicrobiae bacterium]